MRNPDLDRAMEEVEEMLADLACEAEEKGEYDLMERARKIREYGLSIRDPEAYARMLERRKADSHRWKP